ncbi:MAG: DUF2835 domain-containing protein [Pseudomonadota bacterium]
MNMTDSGENFRRVRFSLRISPDLYLSYYQGVARAVVVKSFDGRTIQFPANVLQQFVTHDGVNGVFEMDFDANNKFVAIRRVGD